MHHRHAPRATRIRSLTSLALLALALTSLAQCRLVNDRLTGVRLRAPQSLSARGRCVHHCDTEFEAERRAEESRTVAAQRACAGDALCRAREQGQHARLLAELSGQRSTCKRSCYDEGSGTAGA